MAERRVVHAERHHHWTFIKLDCSHERALGGHVFKGKVHAPHNIVGERYICHDGTCLSRP